MPPDESAGQVARFLALRLRWAAWVMLPVVCGRREGAEPFPSSFTVTQTNESYGQLSH